MAPLMLALVLIVTFLTPAQCIPSKPNIVFILADDFSEDLVQYMPNLQGMKAAGRSFSNFFVSNSFCCPSRTTIFTGNVPHNTGVWANNGPDGGYEVFKKFGNDNISFAVTLRKQGYYTAMAGKYINGYNLTQDPKDPGWTTWFIPDDGGYNEVYYNYRFGKDIFKSSGQDDGYLTDVLNSFALKYMGNNKDRPFMLEVATFAPHAPYTPAPRDANKFLDKIAPRTGAFNRLPTNPPLWLSDVELLNSTFISNIDSDYRLRAQSVLALDKLIGDVRAEIHRLGIANKTYVFFSSDNGYHMGQWRLAPGKRTPLTTDIRVPLVVVGPGIAPGSVTTEITQSMDLCPTFAELAGAPVLDRDGISLVPLMLGKKVANWRSLAYVEQRGYSGGPSDPDWTPDGYLHNFVNVPPFTAIRGTDFLFVNWTKFGEYQYHNLTSDPDEIYNTWKYQGPGRQAALQAQLSALVGCKGASCRNTTMLMMG